MSQTAAFPGLVDLVAAELGGSTLGASDDFFAEVSRLNLPEPALFIPDKYSDRGKWMDGWESRRKRSAGHDFCILRLGVPGSVRGFDIDTSHFRGNQPAFAAVEGVAAAANATFDELCAADWVELLPQTRLLPDAHNLCAPMASQLVTHLRLNIFPDGGVARFRAYGVVKAELRAPAFDAVRSLHVPAELVDLAALTNGARVLACSDAHFGAEHQLILPGRAPHMGSGWETRRRRGSGHDWLIIELARTGHVELLEIDTNHFKGNYPDRCSLDTIYAPGAKVTDLVTGEAIGEQSWTPLLASTKLEPDRRHFLKLEPDTARATHLRLNIYPDGGISRLRAWGRGDG
ncbi:MAG TPA: allantoicase [Polyangiaceae bacterium]|nr:allantoicase [Polyangiaceae bacterium]